MPNWCDNTVTITHADKSKIDTIEKVLIDKDSEEGLFSAILPNPSGEWEYDWCVNNWGTKWDANSIDWDRQDDNSIWVSFDTAWAPPIALYEYMERNEYQINAMYHEPGMGFCGRYVDGYDDFYEYDLSEKETIENISEELLDYTDLLNVHEDWINNQDETKMD
jgi:hypothetical protein